MSDEKRRIPVCFENLSVASQQSWTIPEYYEDETYKCVDCGREVIFTAEQQQEWYEQKKRYFFQRPIRCPTHHEEWRRTRKSKYQMDAALAQLRANPASDEAMRAAARAIVEFHKRTGKGNLQSAIHLFRRLSVDDADLRYCRQMIQGS